VNDDVFLGYSLLVLVGCALGGLAEGVLAIPPVEAEKPAGQPSQWLPTVVRVNHLAARSHRSG